MLGKDLIAALNDISDEKIQDAMDAYKRRRKAKNLWLRVGCAAAGIALLLTAMLWPRTDDGIVMAPSILKVEAYDPSSPDEHRKCELQEGVELPWPYAWSMGDSYMMGIPLTLTLIEESLEGKNIVFDISVSHGRFYYFDPYTLLGSQFSIENGRTIYWHNFSSDGLVVEDSVYTDIIILADDHIVGYAVVKFSCVNPQAASYKPSLVKSVFYPLVNGEFQDITNDYVMQRVMECKSEK